VYRLFLDANVLFTAAHNPSGKAAFLIAAGRMHWELLTSEHAAEEARRNITAKYPVCAARLTKLLSEISLVAQPAVATCPIALPDMDKHIFLAAVAAAATHLITGDMRHFGPHMNRPGSTHGVVIQTVGDFLAGL
jgi:uncharacterized protein